jgi:mannose-6-phosphate isomerase-like protein (cupin superfamily)
MKYTFCGYSGYVITPDDAGHNLLAVRHGAMVEPWVDGDVHCHQEAEEYYFLVHGGLWIMVDGKVLSLKPLEMLMVRPGIPHSIVKGEGLIEHFVFRAPAGDDRVSVGEVPRAAPLESEDKREFCGEWGYRLSVAELHNQNCWLFGVGHARFHTSHLILAYIDFPTEEAGAGNGHRHRLHLHRESWEYYVALEGAQSLRVEDEVVSISAGEMLEVPPGVRHVLQSRKTPYRGMTFRVPILDHNDKVEF